MFDLQKEIKSWKKALRKHRGFEEGYCEELTSHLLDNIAELRKKGVPEKEAFEKSIEQIGFTDEISDEFYKTNFKKRFNMKNNKLFTPLISGYIKLGLRNIFKHKVYSFINIAGLALGLALLIIAGLVTLDEFSFDDFHSNKENIYRVYSETMRNGQKFSMAPIELPFVPAVKEEFSQVEKGVRLKFVTKVVQRNDVKFSERMGFADEDFFQVFSFKLLQGDKKTVLKEPFKVALSKSYAEKYFGSENPLGETILIHNKPHRVSGVFEDMPLNSHMVQNILISFSTYLTEKNNHADRWNQTGNDYSYLLLKPGTDVKKLEDEIDEMIKKYVSESQAERIRYILQPLKEVHFSELNYDFARTTPKMITYIFSSICVFILLIACINFINLSTAKATERAREVGLRKVTGAGRGQLIRQFLIECIVIATFALFVSLIIVKLLLPEINSTTRKMIEFSSIFSIQGILILAALVLITGILAGFYPAMVLSKYDPAVVLRSSIIQSVKGVKLRSILVVSQFVISIILIIANFTLLEQIDFMKTKPLGFKIDDLITLRLEDPAVKKNAEAFKNYISKSKYISNVSVSSGTPFSGSSSTSNFHSSFANPDENIYIQELRVDENFTETFKLLLEEGRFFNKEISTDYENACLINQAAQKKFGWTSSVNKDVTKGGEDKKYKIIGVVKDFHYTAARSKIEPAIFFLNNREPSFLTAHLNPFYKEEGIKFLKESYEKYASFYPFIYFHIEEAMNKNYRIETSIFNFLIACTIIALFVCSLGVLGLVSFTVNKKRKEFGIRKILGANALQLFKNLSTEFYKWILISNIIAWPIAYFAMNKWLQNYSYRIEFNFLTFLVAATVTLVITFGTIGFQLIKALKENPVKSLRCE